MVFDLLLAVFVSWVWRRVCVLLEDQDRIDRFHKWCPFARYPWRSRRRRYWRW
jgi:hypothetical protein